MEDQSNDTPSNFRELLASEADVIQLEATLTALIKRLPKEPPEEKDKLWVNGQYLSLSE